jgi:hypothetical protein
MRGKERFHYAFFISLTKVLQHFGFMIVENWDLGFQCNAVHCSAVEIILNTKFDSGLEHL